MRRNKQVVLEGLGDRLRAMFARIRHAGGGALLASKAVRAQFKARAGSVGDAVKKLKSPEMQRALRAFKKLRTLKHGGGLKLALEATVIESMSDKARRAMFAKLNAAGGASLLKIPAVQRALAQTKLAAYAKKATQDIVKVQRNSLVPLSWNKGLQAQVDARVKVLAKIKQFAQARNSLATNKAQSELITPGKAAWKARKAAASSGAPAKVVNPLQSAEVQARLQASAVGAARKSKDYYGIGTADKQGHAAMMLANIRTNDTAKVAAHLKKLQHPDAASSTAAASKSTPQVPAPAMPRSVHDGKSLVTAKSWGDLSAAHNHSLVTGEDYADATHSNTVIRNARKELAQTKLATAAKKIKPSDVPTAKYHSSQMVKGWTTLSNSGVKITVGTDWEKEGYQQKVVDNWTKKGVKGAVMRWEYPSSINVSAHHSKWGKSDPVKEAARLATTKKWFDAMAKQAESLGLKVKSRSDEHDHMSIGVD